MNDLKCFFLGFLKTDRHSADDNTKTKFKRLQPTKTYKRLKKIAEKAKAKAEKEAGTNDKLIQVG